MLAIHLLNIVLWRMIAEYKYLERRRCIAKFSQTPAFIIINILTLPVNHQLELMILCPDSVHIKKVA